MTKPLFIPVTLDGFCCYEFTYYVPESGGNAMFFETLSKAAPVDAVQLRQVGLSSNGARLGHEAQHTYCQCQVLIALYETGNDEEIKHISHPRPCHKRRQP
jgi:hypothetical protein